MADFRLVAPYQPAGDQPRAIEQLVDGLASGMKKQTLLGVTGSGKTYTIAAVVERLQRPTLVLTHNKTLAAQLYREFKEFFPDNAVEYFVSYYDYYQPEAYVAATDTYIEKDSSINDEIDLMRLSATSSLLARRDVLIVASVSCIYGLGSPEQYRELVIPLTLGMEMDRNELVRRLVAIQYERSDAVPLRSTFRVRGDVVDILPAYDKNSIRVSFFGDEIERLQLLEKVSGRVLMEPTSLVVYPAKHFVTTKEILVDAVKRIESELEERLAWFRERGRLVEAHRLEQRTRFDLEMLHEIGYCKGIENYSRHISGRAAGERPAVLLDYFPEDFLVFVDESHVSLPQLQGMYRGDRARKENLVEFGFRLPSALDNRPLFFEEFDGMARQAVYVSATPAEYERSHSEQTAELIIRPTGLVDPPVEVRPAEGQIDDLLAEIGKTTAAGFRTLVTTLTKRMSEELTAFLAENGIRVRYLHSEIETIERVEILHDLRAGVFDVLVGINLLREGLDLPEVALVAILDADKIGFLRSAPALIQTSGRAARNVHGHVVMYGDRVSDAMETAIGEMARRREKQLAWNAAQGITPRTIEKEIGEILYRRYAAVRDHAPDFKKLAGDYDLSVAEQRLDYESKLEERMHTAAENLEFEQAAAIRDELARLRGRGDGGAAGASGSAPRQGRKKR